MIETVRHILCNGAFDHHLRDAPNGAPNTIPCGLCLKRQRSAQPTLLPTPTQLSMGRVKPRYDLADYSLDVPLGPVTVTDVAYP